VCISGVPTPKFEYNVSNYLKNKYIEKKNSLPDFSDMSILCHITPLVTSHSSNMLPTLPKG
jgi:hypothetical protein